MRFELHLGDNREVLRSMPSDSVDSIVCDPPYELGFMGKRWDSTGIAYDVTLWTECLRVLKPGGHLLAFGGSRTYHRLAVAIEDAGFEIRDCIMWLYASGFPKSHDVSKALDKQAGAEREMVRTPITPKSTAGKGLSNELDERPWLTKARQNGYHEHMGDIPATPLAQQWQGWGTALKPAHEPIVVARKPLHGTVADNVQAWGVGALNIDGCRIETTDDLNGGAYTQNGTTRNDGWGMQRGQAGEYQQPSGRWPANIILDEEAAQMLDEQSDGASRFFYVAKASKAEREAGLEGMPMIRESDRVKDDGVGGDNPRNRTNNPRINHHPTVKPIALMRYLVRMVAPPRGVILDPFMGSGTTGCAAMLEGMRFIGIDITPEYVDIADRRIQHWASHNPMGL